MKNILKIAPFTLAIAVFVSSFPSRTEATYTILRDAGSLTRGIVTPERLPVSSVTLQGPIVTKISVQGCSSLNTDANGVLGCAAGGAGGTGAFIGSTITKVLACNGEQFFATTSFIPCQGAWDNIGRTTFVITALQAFTSIPSTVGATAYRIVDSSSIGGSVPFSYVSPNVVVDTATRFSVWKATIIPVWADHTIALHITTAPISGTMSAEGGFKIEGYYLPPGPSGVQGP